MADAANEVFDIGIIHTILSRALLPTPARIRDWQNPHVQIHATIRQT